MFNNSSFHHLSDKIFLCFLLRHKYIFLLNFFHFFIFYLNFHFLLSCSIFLEQLYFTILVFIVQEQLLYIVLPIVKILKNESEFFSCDTSYHGLVASSFKHFFMFLFMSNDETYKNVLKRTKI